MCRSATEYYDCFTTAILTNAVPLLKMQKYTPVPVRAVATGAQSALGMIITENTGTILSVAPQLFLIAGW